MTFGIELLNNDYKVVVSSQWPLARFLGKGTLAQREVIQFREDRHLYVFHMESPTVPEGLFPQGFYYMPQGVPALLLTLNPVEGGKYRMEVGVPTDHPPELYWFVREANPQSYDLFGMRLFSASGELNFDSGWVTPSMLLADALVPITPSVYSALKPAETYSLAQEGNSVPIPYGITKPAVSFTSSYWRQYRYPGGLREYYFILGLKRDDATTLTIQEVLIHYYKHWAVWSDGMNKVQTDDQAKTIPVIDGAVFD